MQLIKLIRTLILAVLMLAIGNAALAQTAAADAQLKTPVEAFETASGEIVISVSINMNEEWYTYANDPGGMGKPTVLTATAADGTKSIVFYPDGTTKPDVFDPSVMVNKYLDGTNLYAVFPKDTPFPISFRLDLLLCHPTKCVPARKDFQFDIGDMNGFSLPSAEMQNWWDEFTALSPGHVDSNEETDVTSELSEWDFNPRYLQPSLEVTSLFKAIAMGLLAGLILNIMPCVLPVVSLKLSALLNSSNMQDEKDRISAFREHNIYFALGAIAFFVFLAIILGATGQAWGALFQNQWLVMIIAMVILALSLSLFGFFHLPIVDLKFGSESDSPRVQAFFTGNLTTLLATPCSGPFLGGVLSWALVQGPVVIATVFISIGLGMSSPYILMAINPRLSRFLPKSGPWIEYVEKGIAFFLVATSFYLISIALGSQTLRILAPLWAILFGIWIWRQTQQSIFIRQWTARLLCVLILIGAIVWTTPPQIDEQLWVEFTPAEFNQRVGKEAMLLDFTADWCPTCKVLEATVLTPENVSRWKNDYDVTFVRVDMTERNVEAENLLKELGSVSLPTAAFFLPGDDAFQPWVLRDIFTETQLENLLQSWKK